MKNLILFLGANDCLKTVMQLELKDMEQEEKEVSDDPEERRRCYNLTSEKVFEDDYKEMVRQISKAISPKTEVFVGTVPHVTIPPITRGIEGKKDCVHNGLKYFSYYAPFFANQSNFKRWRHKCLTVDKVKMIDERINVFNCILRDVIKEENNKSRGKDRWHIVDICGLLDKLAVRRQDSQPDKILKKLLGGDHALLNKLDQTPSVLRFETHCNKWIEGGLFSLDCLHPTTIGYGLIAEEFLREMKTSELCRDEPERCNWELDWDWIIERDTLIQSPPAYWDDIIQLVERYTNVSDIFYRWLT